MSINGDELNRALGDELRAAVLDRHRDFPKLADFAQAVAARGFMSAVTVGRLMRANTTIRVDYLCELCAVLGIQASSLLREIEDAHPEWFAGLAQPVSISEDSATTRSGETLTIPAHREKELEAMSNELEGGDEAKGAARS